MQLHWQINPQVSCLHAVTPLATGKSLADTPLANALQEPTAELLQLLDHWRIPVPLFCMHAVPLAATQDGSRQLASVSLTKTIGTERTEQQVNRLAGILADLFAAFSSVHRSLVDDLRPSVERLRLDWETRGAYWTTAIGLLTEPELLVDAADVIAVTPCCGGGGAAHLLYNSVRVEAISDPDVGPYPEILRLAWLLAQLNIDVPKYQGEVHRDRLPTIAAHACLPAVVTAAAKTGLVTVNEQTLTELLIAWDLQPEPEAAKIATLLLHWWETYTARRPRWLIALGGLDQIL